MALTTVLALGGTITMRLEDDGRRRPQAADPSLIVPQLANSVRVEQIATDESANLTGDDLRRTAIAAREAFRRGEPVVVTTGTDSLAETAYFLAELLGDAPLTVTGAMTPADAPSPDGPANLAAAIARARRGDQGTAVAMNGSIFSALSVEKLHTTAIDAFAGTDQRLANHVNQIPLRTPQLDEIVLLPGTIDPPMRLLEPIFAARPRGIVLEGLGTGSLPDALGALAMEAAASGIDVVLTTRNPAGPVRHESAYPRKWDELIESGIHLEDVLRGQKARIRLAMMQAVGRPYVPARVRTWR